MTFGPAHLVVCSRLKDTKSKQEEILVTVETTEKLKGGGKGNKFMIFPMRGYRETQKEDHVKQKE